MNTLNHSTNKVYVNNPDVCSMCKKHVNGKCYSHSYCQNIVSHTPGPAQCRDIIGLQK